MNNVVHRAYEDKLKNKLFGLLCEYEKNGEWESFLDSILIEINGFDEDSRTINYYILHYKLSNLRYLNYKYSRKTIFDCMTLISGARKEGD